MKLNKQQRLQWKQAARWNREDLNQMKKRYKGKCRILRKKSGSVDIYFGGKHRVSFLCLTKRRIK